MIRMTPKAALAKNHRRSARGFTLIEISISLLIVGLMLYIGVPAMESVVGIRARKEAGYISGAVRYMYSTSALTGQVCRLTFDMDERSWWPECTTGRFTVSGEKERSVGGKAAPEEKKEEKRGPAKDEFEALRDRIEAKPDFSGFTTEDVKKHQLPDGANVAVWTAHQTDRYTKGKAYLYFFPQGHTEKALITVSSDHGDVYELQVSPLNGKVRILDHEVDVPRG